MGERRGQSWAVSVENLTVAYNCAPVLTGVDVRFPKGQMTAIVGPNGAGKSTLLKSMLGLMKPLSGSVILDVEGGKGAVGYVPQSASVDWDFPVTVADVVLMGRYGQLGWFRRPTAQDKRISHLALQQVGMGAYGKRQISQLSGGQQQRVFLARALAQEAELYFLDEPFKGVDMETEAVMVGLLKDLKAKGKTMVVVHHDLDTLATYFDHMVLMNQQVVAQGTVETVLTPENLRRAYGRGLHGNIS